MAPRKLPPGQRSRHIGVTMPEARGRLVQSIAAQQSAEQGRPVSASSILRDALAEYLTRRFGPASEREAAAS